jgi:tetratricopeptide (TPR) repeat protein
LWKALAYARQGKWAEAREKFKNAEFAITSLPIELQRILISEAMRASLEVKDYSGAAKRSDDLEVVGLPPELKGSISVLRGRLAEALGHDKDALGQYRVAIGSTDRAAAAEAKLLEIILRQRRDEISQAEVLRELETLSVTWRGDAVEVRALQIMARIYPETGRYGESLAAARTATRLQPNSEPTRQAQDAAAALFAQLFLSPKGDDLPPVDALGIFYEYRELTPIGRRGDEMIRRLADRLVAVDLLDQASELLQYQVDKRLEGAARAQVAARLAMVYLTSRKPDRAISALRTRELPISRANCASSGCCWRRARKATSDAMIWRSTSSPTSTAAKRSGCAPTSTGRRGAGARHPNRSNCTTPIAGATSNP